MKQSGAPLPRTGEVRFEEKLAVGKKDEEANAAATATVTPPEYTIKRMTNSGAGTTNSSTTSGNTITSKHPYLSSQLCQPITTITDVYTGFERRLADFSSYSACVQELSKKLAKFEHKTDALYADEQEDIMNDYKEGRPIQSKMPKAGQQYMIDTDESQPAKKSSQYNAPAAAWYQEKVEANKLVKEYTQNKFKQHNDEDLYLQPYVMEKQPLLHSNIDDDRSSPPYGAQTTGMNRVVPLSSPGKSTSLHSTVPLFNESRDVKHIDYGTELQDLSSPKQQVGGSGIQDLRRPLYQSYRVNQEHKTLNTRYRGQVREAPSPGVKQYQAAMKKCSSLGEDPIAVSNSDPTMHLQKIDTIGGKPVVVENGNEAQSGSKKKKKKKKKKSGNNEENKEPVTILETGTSYQQRGKLFDSHQTIVSNDALKSIHQNTGDKPKWGGSVGRRSLHSPPELGQRFQLNAGGLPASSEGLKLVGNNSSENNNNESSNSRRKKKKKTIAEYKREKEEEKRQEQERLRAGGGAGGPYAIQNARYYRVFIDLKFKHNSLDIFGE